MLQRALDFVKQHYGHTSRQYTVLLRRDLWEQLSTEVLLQNRIKTLEGLRLDAVRIRNVAFVRRAERANA